MLVKRKSEECDLSLPVDDQPEVKPLREASAAVQRRLEELRAAWAAARRAEHPKDGRDVPAPEAYRARATARALMPKIEVAEVEAIEARDALSRAQKDVAKKLRDVRQPRDLMLLAAVEEALRHAAACLAELGAWREETARVTGQHVEPWLFMRPLTPESVAEFVAYQRAGR